MQLVLEQFGAIVNNVRGFLPHSVSAGGQLLSAPGGVRHHGVETGQVTRSSSLHRAWQGTKARFNWPSSKP